MNSFIARVKKIDSKDNLNIVKFDFNDTTLSMMSLDLNSNLILDSEVQLTVKATHITLAKNFQGLCSDENQLKAKVTNVENGELLSSVTLLVGETPIEAVITAQISQKMSLQQEDEVTLFINPSELSIMSIL